MIRPLIAAAAVFGMVGCQYDRAPRLALFPRGHQELVIENQVSAHPLLLGTTSTLEVCVHADISADSSQWRARWSTDGRQDAAWVDPAVRFDRTLCFPAVAAGALPPGRHDLCAELRDDYDGRLVGAGCLVVENRVDSSVRTALIDELMSLLKRAGGETGETIVASLAELEQRALRADLPLLSLRLRLIEVYQLRRSRTATALQRAARLLDEVPTWIDAPAAREWAAHLDYERAALALEANDDRQAWAALGMAEQSYAAIADRRFIVVANKQADILARAGAVAEAQQRLETALERCQRAHCEPTVQLAAQATLAWATLLDPDASDETLAKAERALQSETHNESVAFDRIERANDLINLAYAQMRCRIDHRAALEQARALLATRTGGTNARAREVTAWSELVDGLASLARGQPEMALAVCRESNDAISAQLAAWKAGCRARAQVALGHWDLAAADYAQALGAHRAAAPTRAGADLSLGVGQRADDFYDAMTLELDRGHLTRAWEILEELDQLSHEPPSRPDDANSTEIASALSRLRQPAASGSKQLTHAAETAVRAQLQDQLRGARPALEPRADRQPLARKAMFRAVATPREIVLLERHRDGKIEIVGRTARPRRTLLAQIDAVRRALRERRLDDAAWAQITAPLAAALLPSPNRLGSNMSIALHGVLQAIPLAALPLPAGSSERWLGERTVVAVLPVGTSWGSQAASLAPRRPLFVVDPNGNLQYASAALDRQRRRFPTATLLVGSGATHGALLAALDSARWLHLDAHARYDEAYPDLSTIELADRPLLASELARPGLALEFANLSGCGTGRWPATADSGRYGLAGELARSGVPWVIATTADLPDEVAGRFNDAFYTCLAKQGTAPDCYGEAIRLVAHQHPAVSWAGLLLLHLFLPEPGKTSVELTPPAPDTGVVEGR